MPRIKIGVIGLGGIAGGVHLPGIAKCKDFELAALCDIDREKLDRIGDQYGIGASARFTDYRDLVVSGGVEAVDICTPNDCHFEMAMEAVKARKPYAVEKPVTMNAGDAETLARRTKEQGVKNMVCFSYRFKTAARYARHLVQSGVLGELYHVYTQYLQAWGNPDFDTPLVWRFIKDRAGSGALGDLGCHALDLARFVTGRNYTRVVSDAGTLVKERPLPGGSPGTGIVDVDDYCHYLARMEGGVSAVFEITRFGFGRGNFQRLELYGRKGALVYKLDENPGIDELEICVGQPLGQLNTFVKVPVPHSHRGDQMQSFADIINGKPDGLAADIEDGLANQKILDAAIKSFENERWAEL
ncbi:MAG: Gfo/Idh/MocA family oxidoreductase [Treponema sp.]|jgi:predicted dehydrogenase|nr:Gfo/Idh/MocA family oxidoreductase [Treponema sp.]